MKKAFYYLLVVGLFLVGCDKKNNDSNNNQQVGYTLNTYGQCTLNGQIVQQNLCLGNTGYTLNAYGQCIQTTTGQQVQQTFCTQTGVGVGQQCVGQFYYQNAPVLCQKPANCYSNASACQGAYDCTGYTVTTQQGQSILCQ